MIAKGKTERRMDRCMCTENVRREEPSGQGRQHRISGKAQSMVDCRRGHVWHKIPCRDSQTPMRFLMRTLPHTLLDFDTFLPSFPHFLPPTLKKHSTLLPLLHPLHAPFPIISPNIFQSSLDTCIHGGRLGNFKISLLVGSIWGEQVLGVWYKDSLKTCSHRLRKTVKRRDRQKPDSAKPPVVCRHR